MSQNQNWYLVPFLPPILGEIEAANERRVRDADFEFTPGLYWCERSRSYVVAGEDGLICCNCWAFRRPKRLGGGYVVESRLLWWLGFVQCGGQRHQLYYGIAAGPVRSAAA